MQDDLKNENDYILIIDDEMDICFMLGNLLKQKLFNIVAAHTLREANVFIKQKKPRLVFLDNNLPDGKGIDFLPLLKKENPIIKVVMITAYDTSFDEQVAFSKGVDGFIGKPFTRQKIFATLDKLLF